MSRSLRGSAGLARQAPLSVGLLHRQWSPPPSAQTPLAKQCIVLTISPNACDFWQVETMETEDLFLAGCISVLSQMSPTESLLIRN